MRNCLFWAALRLGYGRCGQDFLGSELNFQASFQVLSLPSWLRLGLLSMRLLFQSPSGSPYSGLGSTEGFPRSWMWMFLCLSQLLTFLYLLPPDPFPQTEDMFPMVFPLLDCSSTLPPHPQITPKTNSSLQKDDQVVLIPSD